MVIDNIITAIKAATLNANGETRVQITSTGTGCSQLLKGRGKNSLKEKTGLDLNTVTKTSVFEARIGNINYAEVKAANGYETPVQMKTGEYSYVPGLEGILAMNNKTGEYQLRYFVKPQEDKHISTSYVTADGETFNPYDEKYADFRREKKEISEDHVNDMSVRFIGIGKIVELKVIA